jgi:hypothetical protein
LLCRHKDNVAGSNSTCELETKPTNIAGKNIRDEKECRKNDKYYVARRCVVLCTLLVYIQLRICVFSTFLTSWS